MNRLSRALADACAPLRRCSSSCPPRPSRPTSEPKVDPTEEFLLEPWFEIEIGPLDLSITKAVLYLVIAARDLGARHAG